MSVIKEMHDKLREEKKKKRKKNQGGIIGGIGYVVGKAVTGALDVVEDTADVLIGTTADLLGFDEFAKKVHTDDYTDKWNYSLDEWYNPNGVVKTIGDIGSGIGQSATYVGLSLIPYAGPALAKTAMAGSGVGSGIQSAVEKTGELGAKEYIYGGLSGATEVALESLTGAAGKVATKLAKPAVKGVKSVAKSVGKESAEALAKKGAKSAAKTVGRKGIIRTTLSGMTGEAFEEGTSEYLNAKYQNWTGVDKDAKATIKDIAYSAFVGAMSGGALTAGSQGIKNASNLRKGTRIVENGNAEAAINTAKHFSKTLNLKAETSGANAERIRGQYSELLQQIDKAVDAYEKLPDADKEGTRARLYLGEIQETVAYVEMAAKSSEASIAYKLVLESKPEEAERYAKVVSTVTGKTVTADDIRNNTPMFGKLGAMDMLGAIKYAGEVATDAENSMIENERLNELKNQAIKEANVGTDMEGAAPQKVDKIQTATPSQKSTLFAQKPNLNAQVNPSVAPDASVNTAENVQISTEAQAVAENANVQATTAETQNAGMEKVSIESKKDYDEWFAKNKAENYRNSKHASDRLVSAMLDNGFKPSQVFNYDSKTGSSTYNSKLGYLVTDMARNTEGKNSVSAEALAKSLKHNKKAINQLKVSDYDNRSQAFSRLEAKILGNAIEIDGKPLPKWFLSLYGNNYGVSDRYADTGIEGAETSNEGNVKRSLSEEEIKKMHDEAEARKKAKEPKQPSRGMSQSKFEAKLKKEKADAEAKAKAEAEAKEATKQAHWDAYTKARDEATLALGVDQFALMSAEARDRVTRMYMELSGVKGVTAETKKALASILAVRPGLYVFTTDKLADNGAWWYNKATGGRAIVINKNSGAITNTLLHEITHDLAKENSKHYENLSKAVLANTSKEDQQKVYDAYLMRHLLDLNQIDESTTLEEAKEVFKTLSKEQQKKFDDMAKEEITTRAVAEKLGQKNFLHEHGKEHRFAIMKAIAHLRKLGSSLVHRSTADKYVREIEKNFAEAVGMGKSNVKIPSFVNIDEEDENHLTVMRSLESYLNAVHDEETGATRESGRDILLKYLTKTYGQGDAMQIVSQMDSIAEVMKAIESEHPELNIFSNWNSTQIEIDENGHPIFTTSIKNGDYKLNQDFSRVCKKRRQLDYVLNYLASRPDFYAEYLSKEDFVKINQAIKKHGFEIACDLCFVDAKRFRQTEWALSFTNTWNDLFESIYSSGTVIRFHFANDQNPSATDVEIDKNKPISYRKWTEGKVKSTVKYKSVADLLENEGNTQVKAMVRFMINHPEARGRFNANDIISSKGFDNIQRYSADLRKMLDGWQGSAAPKPSSSDTVYDNSIVNTEGYNAKTAFAMGGSRMNSFSDFMAHMFFDYCQAFSELAAKRMPVQSYTKELIFARLFGLTGAKINLSGVPAVRENATTDKDFEKSVAGLNLDRLAEHLGKSPEKLTKKEILANLDLCDYLWSKESINMKYATLLQSGIMYDRIMDESVIDECYSLIQEGKFDEAFALAGEENVNKEYAKHVGTIVVGVSEAHIRKLLRDNTVRMVIPYHRSGLNPTIAKAMKIAYYHDYTNVQSTRVQMKGKKSASKITSEAIKEEFALKDFDFYEYFGKNINGKVISGKAVARRYLEWCENGVYDEKVGDYVYYTKDGYILASEFHKKAKIVPKFSQFTNEENYYKLLEDFDVYDTITGKHSAQNSVKFGEGTLPNDYRSVLLNGLQAEQNTYEDFISAFNNETKLDGIGLGEEIMGIMDEARERVEGKTNIHRSINIEDRIITTHDDRTTTEKAKDFVKDVKSRCVKGNAQVAKSKGEDAFVKTQIQLTNAQAGIEYFLKQEGMSQLEVEASVNMVRMSARKGTAAITAKQTDINGNIIGDGFNEIMRPINKSNREDFKSYWVHKLNTYRAPRGKAIFKDVTAEQSASEVERLEKLHPEFKDVLEKLNEFDKNALQLAVDARLISQEQADAYHQLNPYYFPVVRFKDADPKKFKSGAFRFKNLNKQAKGGEADIVDPIEAYMDHIVTLERSAYINILANAIYDHEDGINVVSARERIPNFDKKLKDEGREGLIGMNYRDGIEPKSNTIVFFKDGEALAIDVSTEIMDGFRALQGDHNSYFDSAIGKANTAAIRLFSKLVTTYNPFFIIRNMVRDFQDAGIYSQFGLRKFAKTYATTAIYQIMTNGKYWQEYIANGGFDTSMFDYSLGTESNRIGLKKAQGNPLSQAATLFENTQIFVEQLPRFTEFLLSRQAGNDIKTSLYFAADVTVNFGRSGKLTKTLGKTLIPFLNPSVQGFSKNVRHFKDATNFKDYERWKKSAKSFLISAAALGIAPILLSNLMYEDDEEYQTLSDNIKTNYYLIRYGEGKYIRVPRGRLSSAFASVTNTTQSQVKSKKVDARQWMDTFENVMSNTTPFETATRTIFSPITDAKTNTTWYGGEIESQAYDHVAPAQRYDEYTSGIAKWLGKTFNDSPKKIDYVLDQYSGVIGDILLPLTADKRKSDNVVETLFSSMVTDATYSNKLSKEFYEIYDEVDFAEETMDNVLVKKHLEKVKTAVRDLNKDIDKINADSSLSDEEKVKRAKEIRVLINRTYKTAIDDYELVKQKAQTVQSAYENVFTTAEVTKTNYKALGLDKDDIGMYAIVYSVGDESYAAQTRDTIDEAQEYLESALERAAFADMYLDAYGAEAAMKAYSSSFYEKATVANALGADYENMYRLLLETRYMSNAEKKKRVNEYLRSMPYPTNVKYLIKYIFGDTTKKTKQRAALALKNANIDEETKKEWLKKLK